jgi:RNA polymerase sigma-70 factor, ECF subfamily
MEEDEALLVSKARQDPLAFGVLYERNVDRIYNYIYQRTGSSSDAEDLTARTFIRALVHVDTYVSQGVPFSAWLYRIAHNAVANWHRDRHRHTMVSLDVVSEVGTESDRPEDVAQTREETKLLLNAIRRMPDERQQLLILKFSEGLSNTEIAAAMGRTEGAIKSLYHRTLLALRQELRAKAGYER